MSAAGGVGGARCGHGVGWVWDTPWRRTGDGLDGPRRGGGEWEDMPGSIVELQDNGAGADLWLGQPGSGQAARPGGSGGTSIGGAYGREKRGH